MRKLIFSLIATLMLPLGMSAQAYTQSKYYNPQTGHLDYNENRPSRMYEAGKRYYGLRIGPSFSVVNSDDKALDGGKWQTGLNIGAVVGQPLTDSAPLFLEAGLFYTEKGGKTTYQNKKMTYDLNYLEVPFDLSRVLFITTANTTSTIPAALLDRMEVIELSSYTDEEKLQIAKRHLLPKQLAKHGLKRTQVRVSDDAIREIIACYTRESGVRSLERQIAALCRKCAMRFVSDEPPKRISITGGNLEDFLGVRKFLPDANVTTDQVGLVTGLAWTAVGGTTLDVEVNVVDGSGKLELTGNLGDVMKESAFAAMSFIRSRAKALGLAPDFYKTKDIHVHFPEGAVPKDGPSAGITICTAIVSALTNRPVRRDVAMTGEISIRGRVLAIGGLKEKTMAALRHGVKTVIIPAENEKDLEEIDQTVRQALQFITVSSADRVLEAALLPAGDAAEAISVPAAPALPIPAPKTRRKPGIRQ